MSAPALLATQVPLLDRMATATVLTALQLRLAWRHRTS